MVSVEWAFTNIDKGKGVSTQQKELYTSEEGFEKNITRHYCWRLGQKSNEEESRAF